MAIINKALGPHCHSYVVQHCQKHPFSIGIYGSSDTDVEKMNPATVRIFDINRSKTVTSHFYHMCVTSGRDASKARTRFDVFEEKIEADEIPWTQIVSLSVDNTNSMVCAHNSLASRLKAKNPETYVLGCPCHLAHIAASGAHDAFAKIMGISAEELLIDQYHWFEKSTKRKGILLEYMQFCNQEYGKILKHSSTRWLSLERCIQRTVEKYAGLKSYFLSEDAADARFKRLHKAFENPLTEVSLFFHNASTSLFTNFNKLLQSDEPSIHIVYDSVIKLATTLTAWKEAKVVDGSVNDQEIFHYRVDILWWHLSQMVIPESSAKRFCHLQNVAELVVVLPHSNAGEERLFSMVRKNKTDSRSSLKLEGTLSNLLAMKLQYPEDTCIKFNPDENLISASKKAAKEYNRGH